MIATTAIGKHCLDACAALGVDPEILAVQKDDNAAFAPVVQWMHRCRFRGRETFTYVDLAVFWSGERKKITLLQVRKICNPLLRPVPAQQPTSIPKLAKTNKTRGPGHPSPHTLAEIMQHFRMACAALGVDPDGLLARTHSRTRSNSRERERVIKAMRSAPVGGSGKLPSYPAIGRLLGYDHSTVIEACQRCGELVFEGVGVAALNLAESA